MEDSGFKMYSMGTVLKDKVGDSVSIEVLPQEKTGYVDGEVSTTPEKNVVTGQDASGKSYSGEVTSTNGILADWISFGSNRHSAPDVVAGETVILWRYGNNDEFYWTCKGGDDYMRVKETIVFTVANKSKRDKEKISVNNAYYVEMSTVNKSVSIVTNKSDEEPYAYTVQIDTATGRVVIQDDSGNTIMLDSPTKRLLLENSDRSKVDVIGKSIFIESTDSIVMKSKDIIQESKTHTVKTVNYTNNASSNYTVKTASYTNTASGSYSVKTATANIVAGASYSVKSAGVAITAPSVSVTGAGTWAGAVSIAGALNVAGAVGVAGTLGVAGAVSIGGSGSISIQDTGGNKLMVDGPSNRLLMENSNGSRVDIDGASVVIESVGSIVMKASEIKQESTTHTVKTVNYNNTATGNYTVKSASIDIDANAIGIKGAGTWTGAVNVNGTITHMNKSIGKDHKHSEVTVGTDISGEVS